MLFNRMLQGGSKEEIADNVGRVVVQLSSYNNLNLNREIYYEDSISKEKVFKQLPDNGKIILDLPPGSYSFGVKSVPPNCTHPVAVFVELDGGTKKNINFMMNYTAIDSNKTVIRVQIETFDGLNKQNIPVSIGTNNYTTDATGTVSATLPAYSSGSTLASYQIKIQAPKGYKSPTPETVTAISATEIVKTYILEEQTFIIYGVRIDKNDANPAAVEYTDDAVGMVGGSADWWEKYPFNQIQPVILQSASVGVEVSEVYELSKTNITQKADGTWADLGGDTGNVMIRFPQIWLHISSDASYVYVKISDAQVDSTYQSYADMRGGIHKGKFYVGRYLAINTIGRLKSVSGTTPASGSTMTEQRNAVRANGAGYELCTFYIHTTLQALFLIFYKNRDSQAALGQGFTNGSVIHSTGQTNVYTGTGNYGNTGANTIHMMFLWIEDFWGNLAVMLDGIISVQGSLRTMFDPNKFNTQGTEYTEQGKITNVILISFLKDVFATNELGFLPKKQETSASSSTYYCDSVNINNASGLTAATVGGFRSEQNSAGVFRMVINDSYQSSPGYRICYI